MADLFVEIASNCLAVYIVLFMLLKAAGFAGRLLVPRSVRSLQQGSSSSASSSSSHQHGGFAGRRSGYRGASTRGVILGTTGAGYLPGVRFGAGDRFWAPLTELSRSPWSH